MADFDVALETSEINVTLVLERTVGGEGGGGVTSWNDLEDKPATFPPSTHNHDDLYFTEAEMTAALAGKSDTSHNHDSRYYTETEIDAIIAANTGKYNKIFRPAVGDYFLTTIGHGASYSSTSPSSSPANSQDRGKLTPFYISETITIDALALYCVGTNDGASAVLRMGIYADSNGRPGNVIVDAGTASINASGLKTLTFTPVVLTPGHYWAVGISQNLNTATGNNPTFASVTGNQAIGDATPAGSNNMFPIGLITQSGALTNSPTVIISRSINSAPFHIWIRRSA